MSVLQGRLDQIIEDTNQFIIKTINKSAERRTLGIPPYSTA